MRPFQLYLKAGFIFGFILCFVSAEAQSLKIDSRSDSQLRQAGERNLYSPTQIGNENTSSNNAEEMSQSIVLTLEVALNNLISSSDVVNDQKLLEVIVQDYNLPIQGFENLGETHSASIQNFVNSFVASNHMEASLLGIYKKLNAEIE